MRKNVPYYCDDAYLLTSSVQASETECLEFCATYSEEDTIRTWSEVHNYTKVTIHNCGTCDFEVQFFGQILDWSFQSNGLIHHINTCTRIRTLVQELNKQSIMENWLTYQDHWVHSIMRSMRRVMARVSAKRNAFRAAQKQKTRLVAMWRGITIFGAT